MKLSVIVPVYNSAAYLERTIESVLAQNYEDFELILVDDGSTDGSGELCDKFAAAFPRVRAIHQENAYVGAARNAGMRMARGEYLYFLDSDDVLCEGVLARVAPYLNGADVVASGIRTEGGKRLSLPEREPLRDELFLFSPFLGQSFYRAGDLPSFSTERKTAEDCEWLFDCLQRAGSVEICPFPFYEYTEEREGSLTTNYRAALIAPTLRTWKKLFDACEGSGFSDRDRIRAYCADGMIQHCITAVLSGEAALLQEARSCLPYLKTKGCKVRPFLWLSRILGMRGFFLLCNLKMRKRAPVR